MLESTFGYLDAGTGSVLLQVVLGGVAAVVVTVKLWWHRLLRLLGIRRDQPAEPVAADREAGAR